MKNQFGVLVGSLVIAFAIIGSQQIGRAAQATNELRGNLDRIGNRRVAVLAAQRFGRFEARAQEKHESRAHDLERLAREDSSAGTMLTPHRSK
jgi:hypothetical protein